MDDFDIYLLVMFSVFFTFLIVGAILRQRRRRQLAERVAIYRMNDQGQYQAMPQNNYNNNYNNNQNDQPYFQNQNNGYNNNYPQNNNNYGNNNVMYNQPVQGQPVGQGNNPYGNWKKLSDWRNFNVRTLIWEICLDYC